MKTCCICRNPIDIEIATGWGGGHNAAPIMDGRCCGECNDKFVIPLRMRRMGININPRNPQPAKKAADNA